MMNEEEMTITTTEPENETQIKTAKPKRTDVEKLRECYEKRERLQNQKMPTGIKDRLSTKAFRRTTPKSQILKAKSF